MRPRATANRWQPCTLFVCADLDGPPLVSENPKEHHGICKRGEIVQGDEGHIGGVAQVVCHGVIVVVGHQEEGQEEKGEKQGEVEGEVEKLRDNRKSWMVWRWGERQVRTALSHVECDDSVTQKTNIYQRASVLRPRACCACACWSCHCCYCPQWSQ